MGHIQPMTYFCKESFIEMQLHPLDYVSFVGPPPPPTHTTAVELNTCDRNYMAHKTLLLDTLQKMFATSVLEYPLVFFCCCCFVFNMIPILY